MKKIRMQYNRVCKVRMNDTPIIIEGVIENTEIEKVYAHERRTFIYIGCRKIMIFWFRRNDINKLRGKKARVVCSRSRNEITGEEFYVADKNSLVLV